jgi:hypothetical protein
MIDSTFKHNRRLALNAGRAGDVCCVAANADKNVSRTDTSSRLASEKTPFGSYALPLIFIRVYRLVFKHGAVEQYFVIKAPSPLDNRSILCTAVRRQTNESEGSCRRETASRWRH